MVNSNFYRNLGPRKLTAIADFLQDFIEVPKVHEDVAIHDIKILKDASSNDISFLSNIKYSCFVKNTKAAACIVPKDFAGEVNSNTVLLRAENSYFAYGKLIDFFYTLVKSYPAKIMKSAYVADSATIGKNCYIGHNAVIEDNAVIGDNSIIETGGFIGTGVVIGRNARIESNVSINYSVIGDDVVILSGAKIGQDGFGFSTEKGMHHKIFHTGIVKIGNNVEISANTTIDRGSLQDTIIEDLCRIDNLVQIGHSVKIGKGSIIVAQAGIAGSSVIGKYCVLGGQVGVAGHLNIGDGAQVAAQGGVAQNIEAGKIVGGSPAVPIMDWHRQSIIMKQLINKRSKYMTIDITEIMDLIPHRYPFLLVDKVVEIDPNKSIIGIKNVTANEPQFTGHFPARPVMPGVLMVEAMAQLAAILVAKSLGSTKNKEVFLIAIENSKFRKVVHPGDTMHIHATIDQQRANVWKFSSTIKVDGEMAAESKFTAMIKDKS